jgi:hypothetical protein
MAMVSDLTPQHQLEVELQRRRALGLGFLWGTAALLIFAFWFLLKPLPFWLAVNLFIAAGVSFFAAVYHFIARGGTGDEATRLNKLHSEERSFGYLLAAVGLLLLAAACWLGASYRLEAFGEALSLGFFAAIALEAGRRLLAPPQSTAFADRLANSVVSARKPAGITLFVAGAVLALAGIVLKLKYDTEFPIFGGLMLLGFVLIPAGLYLYLAEDVNVRPFILVTGGLTGLVISVMVLAHAWVSRELFLGGLSRWRDEAAWQIWLCAYLELLGLLLMFGSVLVARAEIRVKPGMRLALYGYNSVLMGMLLLAFLIVLNVVVYVLFPLTLDWTGSRGLYALSPSSQDILQKLNKPVTVYVLFPQRSKEYREIHTLLDNAQSITDKLDVKYISPDQDFLEYNRLAQSYPELIPDFRAAQMEGEIGRGVLLIYGKESEKTSPHVLIPPRKIVKEDFDPRERRQKRQYIAESSFMTELQYFMEGQKKSKVYFLQGDEELDVNESRAGRRPAEYVPMAPLGAGALIDRLKKENFEVAGLSFAPGKNEGSIVHVQPDKNKRKDVPDDARVVIIAGPSEELPQETLDALDRYMEKNGRLVITLDVVVKVANRRIVELKKCGLEEWLKKFNVDVGADFVLHPPIKHQLLRDPRIVLANVPLESENLLAKKLRAELYVFNTVRVVRAGTKADKYQTETLLEVSPQWKCWTENNVEAFAGLLSYTLQAYEDGTREPSTKPIPIAVTVREGDKPRLVVMGDTEFISNASLSDLSYGIIASAIDWLSDRPGVGARPKESGTYTLSPKAAENINRMANLPLLLMALSIIGTGVGLWVVRRR